LLTEGTYVLQSFTPKISKFAIKIHGPAQHKIINRHTRWTWYLQACSVVITL